MNKLEWGTKVTHFAQWEQRFTFVVAQEDDGMWSVSIKDWRAKKHPSPIDVQFFSTEADAKAHCEALVND